MRRARGGGAGGDAGNAIVEFVFLAIVTLLPLAYLVRAVFEVQRTVFAVTAAAREAGRAMATADTVAFGAARADYAAGLALADQGLSPGASISYAPAGSSCGGGGAGSGPADLEPGSDFVVCVSRPLHVPGLHGFVAGSHTTVTGRYVVHVDEFRTGPRHLAGRSRP